MTPNDRRKVATALRRISAKARRRAAADLADADALDALAALLDGNEYPALAVKAYRERHGLTQQQLAERFAVSLDVVRNWEHGRTMPPADVLAGMREDPPVPPRSSPAPETAPDSTVLKTIRPGDTPLSGRDAGGPEAQDRS